MKKITLSFLTMILAVFALQAKIVYVTTDGNNANDGTSWDKAVADLQKAHDLAIKGDQIWMAAGTYDLSVLPDLETPVCRVGMKDGVDIYGGFKKGDTSIANRERANATDAPWDFTNATVITASAPVAVRPFDRADKAGDSKWKSIIDGIKFYEIETANGRILYINTGTTFQNCWLDRCKSTANNGTYVYFERDALVKDCLFENCTGNGSNVVQFRGSRNDEPGAEMTNCTFRNNQIGCLSIYNTLGAGKYDETDAIKVSNCKFQDNMTDATAVIGINNTTGIRLVLIDNCLIENNTGVSAATTNYAGSLINMGGAGTYVNNCVIRNNKNTIGEDKDYKNSLIFAGGMTTISNSLIANNECAQANISAVGTIVNSTIVNNKGLVHIDGLGTLGNSIALNNLPVVGAKAVKLSGALAWVFNSAFGAENEIDNPSSSENTDPIYTEISTLVAPTDFVGNATTEDQKNALKAANFSLAKNSVCIDGGDAENLFGEVGLIGLIEPSFSKDLAGKNRLSDDGKISIGAYQGTDEGNSINLGDADNIADVYVSDQGVEINSTANGVATVYTLSGSKIVSVPVLAGTQTISLEKGQVYILKLVVDKGQQTFKVVLR